MKLWYLEPLELSPSQNINPWKPWYDKAFGFVVRAETEIEARTLAAHDAGDEADVDFNPWLDSNYSSCIELTNEGASGVILRDFMSA